MTIDTYATPPSTNALPPGFEHEGVYCVRGADGAFQYIPGAPVPQKTARGAPAVSLMSMGAIAMLQLSVQWDITAAQVQGLAARIAHDFPQLDPNTIQIMPAPVSVDGVDLMLDDGQGKVAALQSARASGYRPFAAIFSLPLTDAQNASAMSALKGRAGVLSVKYRVTASIDQTATLTLTGDLAPGIEQVRQAADPGSARKWITQAMGEGRLDVVRSGNADPASQLWKDARQELEDKAADALQRASPGTIPFDRSALKLEVTKSAPLRVTLERTADVGSWFAHSTGDPIQVIPSGT